MRAQRGRNKIPAQGDKYIRRSRSARAGERWVPITIENVTRTETDVTVAYTNDSDGARGDVSYSTFARMSDYRPAESAPRKCFDLDASMVVTATHRLDLARALAGGVVASLAAGDTRGARVALDALRGLVEARDAGAEQESE